MPSPPRSRTFWIRAACGSTFREAPIRPGTHARLRVTAGHGSVFPALPRRPSDTLRCCQSAGLRMARHTAVRIFSPSPACSVGDERPRYTGRAPARFGCGPTPPLGRHNRLHHRVRTTSCGNCSGPTRAERTVSKRYPSGTARRSPSVTRHAASVPRRSSRPAHSPPPRCSSSMATTSGITGAVTSWPIRQPSRGRPWRWLAAAAYV